MKKVNIDVNKAPTKTQLKALKDAATRSIQGDGDCPRLSKAELAKFHMISKERQAERKKQNVTLRLSPQAINTAKSMGKGYTSVLSRIVETALSDADTLKKFL